MLENILLINCIMVVVLSGPIIYNILQTPCHRVLHCCVLTTIIIMTNGHTMSRRSFVRAVAGTAGVAASSGVVTAQSGGGSGPIDFGGWLDDVGYWNENTRDLTGKQNVTVTVGGEANGGLSFDPVAVHVDSGTTVKWNWSGEGGAHNVVAEDGSFNSGPPVATAGTTFSHTFETDGINNYFCQPHKDLGMKGSVAVGSVPRKSAQAAGQVDPSEMGVPLQPHYVGLGAVMMLISSLVFVFYLLKYGESPHTKGGNR